MGKDTSTTRRPRRKSGEPRTCAFVDDDGERCGLLLTAENSYKGSYYCKPHHQVLTLRSRNPEANIERVQRYRARNPEKVQEWSLGRTKRRRSGIPIRERPGRPPGPVRQSAVQIERCARPATSRRWHIYDARGISLCGQWKADPAGPFETRPADAGDFCAKCLRAAISPKA